MGSLDESRSSALIPGCRVEYPEESLLNDELLKIPKDVNLRQIVTIRPLRYRHRTALHVLHARLFPIKYDPAFFAVATGSSIRELDPFRLLSHKHQTQTGVTSHPQDAYVQAIADSQIASFGCFLPRRYLMFAKQRNSYDIEEYFQYLEEIHKSSRQRWFPTARYQRGDSNEANSCSDEDVYLTDDPTYDEATDEFLIGFATMLINMDTVNDLLSDDDYIWLETFYRYVMLPNNSDANTIPNCLAASTCNNDPSETPRHPIGVSSPSNGSWNSIGESSTSNSEDVDDAAGGIHDILGKQYKGDDYQADALIGRQIQHGMQTYGQITPLNSPRCSEYGIVYAPDAKNGCQLNWDVIDDAMYQWIYNWLYTNEEMQTYLNRFDIASAKTVYILSAGVVMGVRGRFLGTSIIVFVQAIAYFFYSGAILYKNNLYTFSLLEFYLYGHLDEETLATLKSLQMQYNKSSFKGTSLQMFYKHVLESHFSNAVKYNAVNDTEAIFEIDLEKWEQTELEANALEDPQDLQAQMPLVLYLHVITYNNKATKMYEHANFLHVTRVSDYYTIHGVKYGANILAHFVHQPSNII